MTHHVDLSTIKLASGSHAKWQAAKGKACLMEWTAIFAGVDYGDRPECTSPVLGAFGRSLNDSLDDERRQRLVPFIPRLVGTAGDPEADEARAWMATDWLVRTFTPAWLRKAGLTAQADALVALSALTSSELATDALPIIESATRDATAAWDAVGAAARDAAWDAARAAAWDAVGAAAGDAARDAAWAAAWDAVGAWDAAGTGKGYSQQYDAAYQAARPLMDAAFRETVDELFESALELFGRMCDHRSTVPA